MKIIISSRRFNPGHFSHLVANYKLFENIGVDVKLLCSSRYELMFKEHEGGVYREYSRSSVDWSEVDCLVVWFPSLAALLDLVCIRIFHRVRIVYIFHEPFESIRSYLDAGFGYVKTGKILLTAIVNWFIVLFSNSIVLPSKKAYFTFSGWTLSRFKSVSYIPLIFDDETDSGVDSGSSARYISYIGTVAEDHAFNNFVDYILNVKAPFLEDGKYKFLIATKSVLDDSVLNRLNSLQKDGKLVLMHGKPFSNAEINQCYRDSLVVWNAYKRSMQSGVLPKAYMHGVPVLVSDFNLSEFFIDFETGVNIGSTYDPESISHSIKNIIDNRGDFCKSCRKFFIDNFFYKSQIDKYRKVINFDQKE